MDDNILINTYLPSLPVVNTCEKERRQAGRQEERKKERGRQQGRKGERNSPSTVTFQRCLWLRPENYGLHTHDSNSNHNIKLHLLATKYIISGET